MAKRKVFGRLRRGHEGAVYQVEMLEDGIWIRRKHYKALYLIRFSHLLNLAETQMKLNLSYYEPSVDTRNKNEQMSGVQEGQLVSHQPGVGQGDLHEGTLPAPAPVPGWSNGMDAFIGPPYPTAEQWEQLKAPGATAGNQLPGAD